MMMRTSNFLALVAACLLVASQVTTVKAQPRPGGAGPPPVGTPLPTGGRAQGGGRVDENGRSYDDDYDNIEACARAGCQDAEEWLAKYRRIIRISSGGIVRNPSGGGRKLQTAPHFMDVSQRNMTDAILESMCCPGSTGGSGGDPHFKTLNGTFFDYHGQCDLVLLQAPDFQDQTGMEIQVRTTTRYDYSFIEAVAFQIGSEVLEVGGWGNYMVNGVYGTTDAEMPATFAGHPIVLVTTNKKTHTYDIHVGKHAEIVQIKTFKDWVSISIINPSPENFGTSKGLMGEYSTGRPLARDGMTLMSLDNSDVNSFGQEWQVLDTDVRLFDNIERAPQFPAQCVLPNLGASASRRLGEGQVSQEAATLACAHLATQKEQELCQYDVLMSGDLEMAEAGAF